MSYGRKLAVANGLVMMRRQKCPSKKFVHEARPSHGEVVQAMGRSSKPIESILVLTSEEQGRGIVKKARPSEGPGPPKFMVAQKEVLEEPIKETQIQPEEELEEINLEAELGSQKPIFINSPLAAQEKEPLVALLKEYMDVFIRTYDEIPALDHGLVVHALNEDIGVKPLVQPARIFHTDVEALITQ
nr:hypothetical protein CFP56_25112 [Quercus suber]